MKFKNGRFKIRKNSWIFGTFKIRKIPIINLRQAYIIIVRTLTFYSVFHCFIFDCQTRRTKTWWRNKWRIAARVVAILATHRVTRCTTCVIKTWRCFQKKIMLFIFSALTRTVGRVIGRASGLRKISHKAVDHYQSPLILFFESY